MVWLTDIWEVLYLQQFPKERLIQPKTLFQIFYKLASKSSSYLLKSCLFNLYQNFSRLQVKKMQEATSLL